jgi:cell wall-associated NlpC family hydrolase
VPRPDIEGKSEAEVKAGYNSRLAETAIKNLQRGDLVFFGNPQTRRITHVGLYIGQGKIIHSSHRVRINSLIPGEADYYENAHRLIAAIRL